MSSLTIVAHSVAIHFRTKTLYSKTFLLLALHFCIIPKRRKIHYYDDATRNNKKNTEQREERDIRREKNRQQLSAYVKFCELNPIIVSKCCDEPSYMFVYNIFKTT